ncbi:inositol monophosphatase family protein [Candidatus Spongiihabitans sp.]|uniref:inositol monophosphatase family protein n=1 Tax=Candidatus Spongiihabitans sp. TaxID=3101308 RepID=UPI003C7D3E1A
MTAKSASNIPDLLTLIEIVKQAATVLLRKGGMPLRKVGLAPNIERPAIKLDGSLVTEVDRRIQSQLKRILISKWPQYGFIGEEMKHADQVKTCQQSEHGYWIVDPLDGTTNFTAGFLFFGVSLALVIDGLPILAVIYDPVRDECFSAQRGQGACLNGKTMTCPHTRRLSDCIANVDYKRLVGELAAQLVRCPPYRSQRNLGSSVLEWCWLAAGRIQLYLHGGQKLWDFSAGYLILQEAGGMATSLSGLPLDCTKLRKRSVVAAVNQQLLDQWVEWIDANSAISQSAPF